MSKKPQISIIKQSEQLELELADMLRTTSEPHAALAARAALDAATMVLQSLGKMTMSVAEPPKAPTISPEQLVKLQQEVDLAYRTMQQMRSSVYRHEGLIGRLVEADEQHQAMAAELAALQSTVAQLTTQLASIADVKAIQNRRRTIKQETLSYEQELNAA